MTLVQEILEWSATRPAWQRAALGRLARGDVLDAAEMAEIASRLTLGQAEPAAPLSLADLGGSDASRQRVGLVSVAAISNVNALVGGQKLTFGAKGLTVVYGDNASGKSGYARLIKAVVRARHQQDVLTNIFTAVRGETPEAIVCYECDGVGYEELWPGTNAPALAQVGFYDVACGGAYINAESEVTYRPSALTLLDGLIRACDGVRDALDKLIAANNTQQVNLPAVTAGTPSAEFLSHLTGRTTNAEIDAACVYSDASARNLAALIQEEGRLRATDPTKERARLNSLADKIDRVVANVGVLEARLGSTALDAVSAARATAIDARAAAVVASSTSFESEPIHGVGSDTWRALWESAEQFSQAEAYRGDPFPVVVAGSHCVLCQQEIARAAADRLQRFQAVMHDQTQRKADSAERSLKILVDPVRSPNVLSGDVAVALAEIELVEPELVTACKESLSAFDERRSAILAWVDGDGKLSAVPEYAVPTNALRAVAVRWRTDAEAIDASRFEAALDETVRSRSELEGREALSNARAAIGKEVLRRRARAVLDASKKQADTTGITRKSTELARAHVTSLVRDRFTRESDRLKLERVTLEDTGGHKGRLLHRPAFLGAAQRTEMTRVLSEGEQTALGLAGYFTEAYFDETQSAMVLDDPVTSLDHKRRAHVARRLAEFARDRQVIVFTHDIAFVGDLRTAADHEDVALLERSVERRGDGSPGICVEQHPWKARDARARLGKLAEVLEQIRRDRGTWDAAMYEKEAAGWAGMLSETWERMISMEIVNQVVDRGTSEVRPRKFRLLARITEDDDREFQESYARCSRWARRHDKSPELNYVAPEIQEMEEELNLVRGWYDRVRHYSD